jgi:hypothetical protein
MSEDPNIGSDQQPNPLLQKRKLWVRKQRNEIAVPNKR